MLYLVGKSNAALLLRPREASASDYLSQKVVLRVVLQETGKASGGPCLAAAVLTTAGPSSLRYQPVVTIIEICGVAADDLIENVFSKKESSLSQLVFLLGHLNMN